MKEKTKIYLKRLIIAYIFAIAVLMFKIYRKNKAYDFYTMTSETLINGTYDIYDDDINMVGKISYEKENNKLIVSISGKEIDGLEPVTEELYHYTNIKYENIVLCLKKYNNEFYYYYDTGESIVLLCLLRSWFTSHSSLEKLSKKMNKSGIMKDRQTLSDIKDRVLTGLEKVMEE